MNIVDWYTRFIAELGQESSDPNNSSAVQELLDSQARERLEAKAMRLKHLGFSEEEVGEEQEKLFDAQVKWAFNKAVDYIRVNGFLPGPGWDDIGFFVSIMRQEVEKLPNCCVKNIRTVPNHRGMISLIAEGFDGKNVLTKTIEFDSHIFEPLPLPPDFNPIKDPEFTTIEQDMLEVLIDD